MSSHVKPCHVKPNPPHSWRIYINQGFESFFEWILTIFDTFLTYFEWFLMGFGCVLLVMASDEVDSGVPSIFPEDHNLNKGTEAATKILRESYETNQVYMVYVRFLRRVFA